MTSEQPTGGGATGRVERNGRASWARLALGAVGLFWVGVILLLAS